MGMGSSHSGIVFEVKLSNQPAVAIDMNVQGGVASGSTDNLKALDVLFTQALSPPAQLIMSDKGVNPSARAFQ